MAGGDQLRGWKDIAAFLGTSVRTARRWEGERALPVRRQAGGRRDAVFAFPEELDAWQHSDRAAASVEAGPLSEPGGRGDSGPENTAQTPASPGRTRLPQNRRRWLAAGGTFVLVGLAVCAIWIGGRPGRAQFHESPGTAPRAASARPEGDAAPVILPSVWLQISRPDGWSVDIKVADGGAAQIGGSAGHPALILRPRVETAGLMLEIARADGRPLKDQGKDPQPMVLLLDREVTVLLRQPYPFSVRWLSGEPTSR